MLFFSAALIIISHLDFEWPYELCISAATYSAKGKLYVLTIYIQSETERGCGTFFILFEHFVALRYINIIMTCEKYYFSDI